MSKKLNYDETIVELSGSPKQIEQSGPRGYSRRDAIRAMAKYSTFAAGASTVVILSAEDAVASWGNCSCFQNCDTGTTGVNCQDFCKGYDEYGCKIEGAIDECPDCNHTPPTCNPPITPPE